MFYFLFLYLFPFVIRNPLHQNKQIIFCACGLRIDTEVRLEDTVTYMIFLLLPHNNDCRKNVVRSFQRNRTRSEKFV